MKTKFQVIRLSLNGVIAKKNNKLLRYLKIYATISEKWGQKSRLKTFQV